MGCFGRSPAKNSSNETSECGYGAAPKRRSSGTEDSLMTQKRLNNTINYLLEEAQNEERGKLKILLLGPGESGKSTIFKQFRNFYGAPRETDEIKMYGVIIRSNVITAVTKLCELVRDLGYEDALKCESNNNDDNDNGAEQKSVPNDTMTVKEAYDLLTSHLVDNTFTEPLPDVSQQQLQKDWVGFNDRAGSKCNIDAIRCLQLADTIEILWKSPTIQEVWLQRAKRNIIDSHAAFLSDVRRIASTAFKPTEDDILKARLRTTRIIYEQYRIDGTDVQVCDVGGQRTERRKWIHCFDDVDAVIFVAALSEYDQKLAEAKKENRMVEAIKLFGSIVKTPSFQDKPILLFLNKQDLFKQKIMHSNIANVPHFSDFDGDPRDFNHGIFYFIQKFEQEFGNELGNKFIHITNATNRTNMEFVLNAARMLIMEKALESTPIGAADDVF